MIWRHLPLAALIESKLQTCVCMRVCVHLSGWDVYHSLLHDLLPLPSVFEDFDDKVMLCSSILR